MAIYWVNNDTGNDGNPGTQAQPVQSIAQAKLLIDALPDPHGHTIRVVYTGIDYLASQNNTVTFDNDQAAGTDFDSDPGIILEGYPAAGPWPTIFIDLGPGGSWLYACCGAEYCVVRYLHFAVRRDEYDSLDPEVAHLCQSAGHVRFEYCDIGSQGWVASRAFRIERLGMGDTALDFEMRYCYFNIEGNPNSGQGKAIEMYSDGTQSFPRLYIHHNVFEGIAATVLIMSWDCGVTTGAWIFNNLFRDTSPTGGFTTILALQQMTMGAIDGTWDFFNNIVEAAGKVFANNFYDLAPGTILSHNNCYWAVVTFADPACQVIPDATDSWDSIDPDWCDPNAAYAWLADLDLAGDYRPQADHCCLDGYTNPSVPEAEIILGALPCCPEAEPEPEPPSPPGPTPGLSRLLSCSERYTMGTFVCYLLQEGAPEAWEFSLGNVVVSSIVDNSEFFPSFDHRPDYANRYIASIRTAITIRLAIDCINISTLAVFFNQAPVHSIEGQRLNLTTLALQSVYRVTLEHTLSCDCGVLRLVIPRASVSQPMSIPFSPDTLVSGEIEIKALYCRGRTDPFGYLELVDLCEPTLS